MITASERLVRMPATICGSAAGQHDPADPLVRRDAVRARRLDQRRVDPAHAVDRVQQHREEAEERDERDLLQVADRVQQDDRDRQQRRRRHRAPVLDVRHRRSMRAQRERPSGMPSAMPSDDGDREAERDPLEARDDVRAELGEEPHVLELDEDRRQPRELRVVALRRSRACQASEERERHGDLGARSSAPLYGARAHARLRPLRRDASAARAARAPTTTRWIATPRKPVASASA